MLGEELTNRLLEPVLSAVPEVFGIGDDLQFDARPLPSSAQFVERRKLVVVASRDEDGAAGFEAEVTVAERRRHERERLERGGRGVSRGAGPGGGSGGAVSEPSL